MSENPYTRSARVTITEIQPDRDRLPECVAWKDDLTKCTFKARYEQNGEPVCGIHVGKPGLVFAPAKMRKEATS